MFLENEAAKHVRTSCGGNVQEGITGPVVVPVPLKEFLEQRFETRWACLPVVLGGEVEHAATEPVTLIHQALNAFGQRCLGGRERHLGVSQVAEKRERLGLAFEELFPAVTVERSQPLITAPITPTGTRLLISLGPKTDVASEIMAIIGMNLATKIEANDPTAVAKLLSAELMA